MAIAYKAQGTGHAIESNPGTLQPSMPATVDANDIALANPMYEGTSATPSTPSGWTLLGGPFSIETTGRQWLFGKICDGTEDGAAVSFGSLAAATMRSAQIWTLSGYESGTITDIIPAGMITHISHATDPQGPTVTTSMVGALACAFIAQFNDPAQGVIAGESGGSWAVAGTPYQQIATNPDNTNSLHTAVPTADPGTISGGAMETANVASGVIGFEVRPRPALTAALTGTITASVTEADIVAGGKTLIITLTNDTWKAAGTGPIGATADTQAIIDGITSAQAEAAGWNAVVKVGIETADVVRTSATVATITLDAEASYNITATETITVTVPATATVGKQAAVATPTFTVATDAVAGQPAVKRMGGVKFAYSTAPGQGAW